MSNLHKGKDRTLSFIPAPTAAHVGPAPGWGRPAPRQRVGVLVRALDQSEVSSRSRDPPPPITAHLVAALQLHAAQEALPRPRPGHHQHQHTHWQHPIDEYLFCRFLILCCTLHSQASTISRPRDRSKSQLRYYVWSAAFELEQGKHG